MVPIINGPIEGERLGIYNQQSHPKHPFNGLRLENTSGVDLMAGPMTVFEADTYAGDSQIPSLHSDESRLISYSLDLSTEIDLQDIGHPGRLIKAIVTKGVLVTSTLYRIERVYLVDSRHDERKILIEHPIRHGWELIEPEETEETTSSIYRFLLDIAEDEEQSNQLQVIEERTEVRSISLSGANDSQIQSYINSEEVPTEVKEGLRGIIERRKTLSDTIRLRSEQQSKQNFIYREQARIRENLEKLEKDTELYDRYISLLSEQEDLLIEVVGAIENLLASEREQREELNRYIAELNIED